MKTTVERLKQIIQEEVDAHVLQEKLKAKEKKEKKTLQSKGNERTDDEDDELEKLQHK
jgi:muconolactone delta-isomerase